MTERLPIQLIEFFRKREAAGEPLALITVVETKGSTYSKAGSQMLVDAAGDYQGLLSGGCLEGDIAERAQHAISSGESQQHQYDLRVDDEVFGFAVGCKGVIHVLIQPLTQASNYAPFGEFVETLSHDSIAELSLNDGAADLGRTRMLAPLRLLILGAGPDAYPLAIFAREMGWRVTVSDHRPAAVGRLADESVFNVECVSTNALSTHFDLDRFDAVIVMSHNLRVDRSYLEALAKTAVPFIGLLGPPHRRDRLLQEIGDLASCLGDRLHAPVGRQIGGRGPAAIALEIVAELQAFSSDFQ